MGRLVRLEIENFKSYKGRQTIGPFHKFTSVIGPNGSGKSNLMDAISFVLGVHSSHLRSQTLKDMIYRSSALSAEAAEESSVASTRSPRRAYVMLAYENAQGREIRFMRTINHNGQSEYRIDDKQVSYAQYNAALEKENILVKAKNFLVFQGDVESVASQNPKDLTKLIEQISGSWEYKEEYDRLKLAQDRAIENSAHAFNKKRGVTSEIKQYQEQKKEAEKFEALVRERRDKVVQYLLWKLYHVEQRTTALEEEANQKRVAVDDANEEQHELEEGFRNARKQQALAHRERTRTELQIKKLKKTLKDERPNSININEKIAHLRKKLEQTKVSGERVKRDHDNQVRVVQDLENSLSKLNEAIQNYEATLPEKGLAKGPVLTAEQVAEYEQLKQQVSIRAIAEQQNLENLQRRYKMEQENAKRFEDKLEELETRKKQLLETQSELQEHQESLKMDAERMQEQLKSRKEDLLALEQDRKNIHLREIELNEKLQETLTRLMEAKVDQRESEKETKFNECLAMMKQIFPGVHGRLSELCRPTQRKYDVAVATTLGRNMDSIVVDDQKTAIECIHYMRDQRVGTATFLPLNTISAAPVNDRFRNCARGARLAVDVVECDRKYENVVRYACGNTLVCDTMQIARQICYDQNENVKAVTLEGNVIHASGLITGGQSSNQARPRWQDQDLEGLIKTRDKLLAELGELNKSKRYGTAEEAAKSDCAGLESRLAVLEKEMLVTQQKLQDVQAEGRHIEGELANSELPRKQVQEKLNELQSNIERVKASVFTVEDEIFADFCSRIGVQDIREYKSLHFDLSAEVTEQRAAFAGQKSRLETQFSFEREQLAELSERLKNLEETYKADSEALQQLELESSTLADRVEKTKQELDTLNNELEQKTAAEEERRQAVEELRRKLEDKGRDVESYLKEIAKYEAEVEKVSAERVAIFRKCKLEDIELPLSRGSMEDVIMDDTTLGMQDNTLSSSMDLDEPSQMSIRSADWTVEVDYSTLPENLRSDGGSAKDSEFKEEIKRLGAQIDEMAPNLKAIDRLDGVESRLRNVEESFDTARRAAKRAKDEFNAVKRERYKRFYDAFSHISERIDQIYKDLTKDANAPQGGTAYLTLEDTDEPYLQGIKYHVTPPTKRFRDMDELSGGEKSIAALALLLAIHSYQPSPFFVLDEVDAALDNINVTKIAAYIREHASDDFQFIVISLKSSLYEKAESLVGIYRDQDVNSSKTLTLKLDQYQE